MAENCLENRAFFKDRTQFGPGSPSGQVPSKPIFDAMKQLLVMDLSGNNLGPELPLVLTKIAPRLQVLMLDGNELKRIDPVFAAAKSNRWRETLKSISLRGNPLPSPILEATKQRGVPGLFAALLAQKEEEEIEARRVHRLNMDYAEKAEREKHAMLERQRNREQEMDERMRAQKAEEIDEKSRGNEVKETQNKVGGGEEAAAAEREADRLIKSAEDAAEAEGKMRASPAPGTEKVATSHEEENGTTELEGGAAPAAANTAAPDEGKE